MQLRPNCWTSILSVEHLIDLFCKNVAKKTYRKRRNDCCSRKYAVMRSFRESAMKCQRCEDSFKVDVRLFGVTRRGYNTQGNSYLEKGSSRSISSVWKGTKIKSTLKCCLLSRNPSSCLWWIFLTYFYSSG